MNENILNGYLDLSGSPETPYFLSPPVHPGWTISTTKYLLVCCFQAISWKILADFGHNPNLIFGARYIL